MNAQSVEPAPVRTGDPSLRGMIVFLLIAAVPVGFVAWRAVQARESRNQAALEARLPVLNQIPDFQLTERSGQPFRGADLRGRIWVADFIFTHCAGPCPLMSAQMARLQKETADMPEVSLVSFSVDPDRDTPPVLRAYAERYGADPSRWYFLTGDMAIIKHLAVEGFKVGDMEDPIFHSTRFILVDAKGHVRGYYDSEEPEIVKRLAADIRALRNSS